MNSEQLHCQIVSLTVAEGKRLIAKGVAALPCVRRAMSEGIVVVTRSTTSGYVLEELLGKPVDRTKFVTGKTVPAARPELGKLLTGEMGSAIFVNGILREGLEIEDALELMKAGDVIIKSPNALDYGRGLVGYLIGAASGGTVGQTLGSVHGRNLHFVAPCGLEKQVAGDLIAAARLVTAAGELRHGPSLWITPAQIVTELDALQLLANVRAVQIAAGGVLGAEGAAWIAVMGSQEQVGAAMDVIQSVRGEPSMLEYVQSRQQS